MKDTRFSFLHFHPTRMVLMGCIFIISLSSCGTPAILTPTVINPTVTPLVETPLPSSTPTLMPTDTPAPTPTIDMTAISDTLATAEMDGNLALIAPKLEKLGFDLESGRLIHFSQSKVSLSVDSYMADDHKMILEKPIQDFIMQADVSWKSSSGLAGCGIVFRAEEDLERGANYQYLMMRLSGAPAWDIQHYNYGQYQYSLLPFTQFTPAIDDRQNAINTITLIVRGDTFKSIINTTKGNDARDNGLTEGGIALLAWQESGETTCTFNNVWIWRLNNPFPNGPSGGAEAFGQPYSDEMIGLGSPSHLGD